MSTSSCRIRPLLLAVPLFLAAGCEDSTSAPALLLDRVSVAMIPGATETVLLVPIEGADAFAPYTVRSADEAVATAVLSGTRLTVTGVGIGRTTVRIQGTGCAPRDLPVQVYDHRVLDTGELLVTFTDVFQKIVDLPDVSYNDAELLLHTEVIGASVWRPVPPAGFHALGSFAVSPSADPNGAKAVMVVKAREGSNALALTTSYAEDYAVQWTRPTTARGARFWHPVCPAGYQAMGTLATFPGSPGPDFPTPCLRQDLTIGGAAGAMIHDTTGQDLLSLWDVDLPDVGPHAGAYLAPGTFVLAQGTTRPVSSPVIHVLKVQLPLLAEAPAQDFLPRLTSVLSPDLATPPRFARAMLVPCTMVNDVLHASVPWRVANSPFYRLERHVYYKRMFHNYNTTSVVQPFEVKMTSGVTTSESQTFKESTNVSITAEVGIELKGIFSAKASSTVSREFGYETQTSVAELVQKEVTTPIHSAPGKAAALWQEYNRYVLHRHDGTALSEVTAWEFGIDSYVVDDYPD